MLPRLFGKYILFLMPSRFIWCIFFSCEVDCKFCLFHVKKQRWHLHPVHLFVAISSKHCIDLESCEKGTAGVSAGVRSLLFHLALSSLTLAWYHPWLCSSQEDHASLPSIPASTYTQLCLTFGFKVWSGLV